MSDALSTATGGMNAATLRLVERLPFTSLHVFPYSPRPGTAATRLHAPVEHGVASERAADRDAQAQRGHG